MGVATLIFNLFYLLPADPARMLTDQREDENQLKAIRQQYGLNLPIPVQYLLFINDLSPLSYYNNQSNISLLRASERGIHSVKLMEFGNNAYVGIKWPYLRQSFQYKGVEVASLIKTRFFNTLILALSAFTIAFSLGVIMGLFAGIYQNTWIDKAITLISTAGMGLPSFVSAILAAWIFAFLLHSYTGLNITGNLWEWDDLGEARTIRWKNLILPALTLGIRPLSVITQMMRSSYLEQSTMPYVLTAISKGLTYRTIALKHILPNALNPVVSVSSSWMASMLAGSVFVEYIFGWNGIGKLVVESATTLDLPVLMGCVLTFSAVFIVVNVLTDLLYRWLDPTISSD
ncbi:peptide ABC transporter permease [Thermaurantimonas aggregans]|uniref:Peptide ABC transporter permease n=1 Tax=Thermaurantimonas aggregans TaxID=2173829 RepID=A0A401XLR2_9FLAO|nr:peptide ABC transporter permease [Thermaurantimonas aggregans]